MNDKKCALITFHAAYNFGSVLQAYATQSVLEEKIGNCTIINYRPNSQKFMYSLVQYHFFEHPLLFCRRLFYLWPILFKRLKRKHQFEKFINSMPLTKQTSRPDKALAQMNNFDVAVSGSDQILNKNSFELERYDYSYMNPYLLCCNSSLRFTYASSFANMSKEQIFNIKDKLEKIDFISIREKSYIDEYSSIIDCNMVPVLDPTFLLSKEQWCNKLKLTKTTRKYILYYSLFGYNDIKSNIEHLSNVSKDMDLDIYVIAPFAYRKFKGDGVVDCISSGPVEFLNLLYNAYYVVAESYHGIALSINFEKNFTGIVRNWKTDNRKKELLEKLNIGFVAKDDVKKITYKDLLSNIDYKEANALKSKYVKESYDYLNKALGIINE